MGAEPPEDCEVNPMSENHVDIDEATLSIMRGHDERLRQLQAKIENENAYSARRQLQREFSRRSETAGSCALRGPGSRGLRSTSRLDAEAARESVWAGLMAEHPELVIRTTLFSLEQCAICGREAEQRRALWLHCREHQG